jgi:flagellar hook assembly protein FlgD
MVWDGRDARGNIVPTGIYLYRVTAGKEKATGTLVVAE